MALGPFIGRELWARCERYVATSGPDPDSNAAVEHAMMRVPFAMLTCYDQRNVENLVGHAVGPVAAVENLVEHTAVVVRSEARMVPSSWPRRVSFHSLLVEHVATFRSAPRLGARP